MQISIAPFISLKHNEATVQQIPNMAHIASFINLDTSFDLECN